MCGYNQVGRSTLGKLSPTIGRLKKVPGNPGIITTEVFRVGRNGRQTSSITGGCTIAGDSGVVRRGGKRDRLVAFRALSQGASIIQALQPSSASWLGSP